MTVKINKLKIATGTYSPKTQTTNRCEIPSGTHREPILSGPRLTPFERRGFSSWIWKRRLLLKLTQKMAAEQSGLSQQAWSRMEHNPDQWTHITALEAVADTLDLDIDLVVAVFTGQAQPPVEYVWTDQRTNLSTSFSCNLPQKRSSNKPYVNHRDRTECGKWIWERRLLLGLTQKAVREKYGIPARTLRTIESKPGIWKSRKALETVAKALDLDPNLILAVAKGWIDPPADYKWPELKQP